jgi:hypothetical protein
VAAILAARLLLVEIVVRDAIGFVVRDAIGFVALDAIHFAARGAIEVEGLDVAGVAARAVELPGAEAVVEGEARVLGGFVVARGGPAVELVASEAAAEAGLDEPGAGRVESRAAEVESGEPQVEKAVLQVVQGGSAARRDGFRVG